MHKCRDDIFTTLIKTLRLQPLFYNILNTSPVKPSINYDKNKQGNNKKVSWEDTRNTEITHEQEENMNIDKINYSKNTRNNYMRSTTLPIQISGKKGWCFIGAVDSTRTCSKVGINDTCMSGDIFPTETMCINPNLRI